MKMHFDEKADALYLRLDESKIVESEEVKPGIVLDFNESRQVVGGRKRCQATLFGARFALNA